MTIRKQAVALLPCPFCGASASIEESPQGSSVNPSAVEFSVGCDSTDEASCMGYQSLTTFPRRSEAIAAWNKRASLVGVQRPEDVARALYEHDHNAPGSWADLKLFAERYSMSWPTYSAKPYYDRADAILALPRTGQPQEGVTYGQLKLAFSLAMRMLSHYEQPDSRFVSDEFVALASVECDDASDRVMAVIHAALSAAPASPRAEGEPHELESSGNRMALGAVEKMHPATTRLRKCPKT